MRGIDPLTWTLVSPLLDQVLDLPIDGRAPFLAELRAERPYLAYILENLLVSHDAAVATDFLEANALEPGEGLAGTRIGAYVLERPLGSGGMGTVWLARRDDGRFEGRAAVKLVNLAVLDRAGQARFRREGTALARLSHLHIARLLDAGVTPAGQPYLVLEYVEGVPIDRYADDRRLTIGERLHLFVQVADAVAHAHANLVVHRDLKPSNVLVDAHGDVKLLDFGIARLLADDVSTPAGAGELTRAAFTPAFAAPEQLMDQPVSVAVDVFALGTLLYLLLSGRHPADPYLGTPAVLVRTIVDVEPPAMSERASAPGEVVGTSGARIAEARQTTPARLRAALRGELDTIAAKALKKRPAERYPSADAMASDVRRYLRHEPISARADSVAYRLVKFIRRNRLIVTATLVTTMAVVAAAAGLWLQARQSAADRDFALQQLARAEAMNDMNTFLLSDAAPLGQAFSAGDLLRRAEDLLNRHPIEPPDAATVESLVSIGAQFQSQDEDANARRVLSRAFELAQKLPAPALTTRARAACALANTLARGDLADIGRARSLADDARGLLPAGRPFVLDRAYCERAAATVARLAGDGDADVAHAREAHRLLTDSGLGSALALLSVEMDLAEAYRSSGRTVEADAAYRAAFDRMRALGRDRTERAGTLLNDWGLLLMFLGRPLDAERAFAQAVEISRADASGASVSPMLLLNAARPVLELGREDDAIAMIDRAMDEAAKAGDEVVQTQALLLLAGAYRQRGDLDRATMLFDEAERRLRQRLPPGHGAFASLALQRGNIALARGRHAEALQLVSEALAQAEASSQGGDLVGAALLRRAQAQLAEGNPTAALADARRAADVERKRSAADQPSSRLGRTLVTLGEAEQAAGRTTDARATLQSAARHLEATLGADHRDTRRAHELLAALP